MEPSDQELIDRVRAGEPDALRGLMRRHGPALYAYLVSRLGNRADADDLYAEAFLRTWRRLDAYKERNRFRAWLFTVAYRLVLDHARDEGRRRSESLDAPDRLGLPLSERLAGAEPGPERAAASAAAGESIAAALSALPEDQRQVFLMREHGGLSFVEIADALDCPLSTALARMRYAVRKLRRDLKDFDA